MSSSHWSQDKIEGYILGLKHAKEFFEEQGEDFDSTTKLQEEIDMCERFQYGFRPLYNFGDPQTQREINNLIRDSAENKNANSE